MPPCGRPPSGGIEALKRLFQLPAPKKDRRPFSDLRVHIEELTRLIAVVEEFAQTPLRDEKRVRILIIAAPGNRVEWMQ